MSLICVTSSNQRRLLDVLAKVNPQKSRDRDSLRGLEAELNRAQIVPPQEAPPDLVTMHSKTRILDLEDQEEMVFTLAFPEEAAVEEGKLSILSPLGTAILGYRAGDTFTWELPQGARQFKILEVVYQPEANGHYTS